MSEHHKENFITKYVFCQDHKMIAKQFLITGMFMAVVGMLMSAIFRVQLANPGESSILYNLLPGAWLNDAGVLNPDKYLALVTMHGTILVFWVLTAGLSGTFANFLIPLQIGARDMASGFLNMLSYWFFFIATVVLMSSLFVESGPASGGWTIYPPLSALPQAIAGSGTGMTLWLISITLFVVGSLLGGLNYIVTILNLRTIGMTMKRLPLTVWALLITAILGVLSFPVLLSCGLLLIFDRSFGTSFYLSDIIINGEVLHNEGGSPILFEHLFWFLGHPEVYIILLPALGIVSEVIAVNSRKPIFGYKAMVGALLLIAFLSFIVWGHHMFMTGMGSTISAFFQTTTMIISVPSVVILTAMFISLWGASIRYNSAMLFALGFLPMFGIGGLTGLPLGIAASDIHLHDTYYVIGHFHYVVAPGTIFALFAGVYYWFPKMTGKTLNETLGKIHFWLSMIFINGIFMPMFVQGLAGASRRLWDGGASYAHATDTLWLNEVMSASAWLLGLAQIPFIYNLIKSMKSGEKAESNHWDATTLEWTDAPSPPLPHRNFEVIPEVYRGPYEYSVPGADKDFTPQSEA